MLKTSRTAKSLELADPRANDGAKSFSSPMSILSEKFAIIESTTSWVISESKLGGYKWGPGKSKKSIEYMNESNCVCFCICLMGLKEAAESGIGTPIPKCTSERAWSVEAGHSGPTFEVELEDNKLRTSST